jgi:AraC-like DNA-binding protein
MGIAADRRVADREWLLLPNETMRMTGSGTATFTNTDDYQAGIGDANVKLVLTGRGDLKGRLTWLKLRHLHVLRGRENVPRIACVSLPPARVFASFLVSADASPIWNGVELASGTIVFHSRGERSYQRTKGASQWALLSLPPGTLAAHGKALTGLEIASPAVGLVLQPSRAAATHLQRLHSKACHLAETKPEVIAHPEAARALEHELIHALVNCLTADDARGNSAAKRHHAEIMIRFEDAFSADVSRQLSMPALCAAVGVPERTLRVCCAEFLGMSPSRYLRLRRLNMVRAALLHADPATGSVAKIAQRYQFTELGRFAAAYRAIFGEMPSDTLHGTAIKVP